jgi:aerobic-type carbon monoxide dehydrogenase small subunit (CoxS/CutS family)
MPITINVNGKPQAVDADPSTPLLYVLRNDLALHGPRFGCGLGQCGACMVHVDGKPTFSCIMPIAAIGERKVTTLEGLLEDGKPNRLQQAFIDEQAAQCGYCISGMVMRAQALLSANPSPTDSEIRTYMRTNLCRCGTHAAILRAIKRAANGQEKRS